MKHKLLFLSMMMFFALATMAKDVKTVVFTTSPKMQCENCEQKIKNNLRFVKGVKSIETSVQGQTVTIKYDADKTSTDKIREGFTKLGYTVKEVNANQKGKTGNCSNGKQKANNKKNASKSSSKCKKSSKGEQAQSSCCGNCQNAKTGKKGTDNGCANCKQQANNKKGEANSCDKCKQKAAANGCADCKQQAANKKGEPNDCGNCKKK